MVWWLWVIVGLTLLVMEMATPGGFFALFFGVGALAVSVLAALGLGPVWQWIAFPVISLALVLLLRGRLQERLRRSPGPPVDSLVGQEVVLLEDLPPGGEARAELRGVPWSARAAQGRDLAEARTLAKGQRCKVERVDGVVLYVKAV
jgi:membrane protein implicated in regulation of membrane protease activity